MTEKTGDNLVCHVFVYGTLKKNHGNHRLLEKSAYVGRDKITGYKLYDLGVFPAVKKTGDDSDVVYGEVYKISLDTLYSLDVLEGHPNFYARAKERTVIGSTRVWVYALDADYIDRRDVAPIALGVWSPSKEEASHWQMAGVECAG
jgi:gamma-glutamylcyclotransferase (GGCT)/AIG2-like uncharacterized protein YtfP